MRLIELHSISQYQKGDVVAVSCETGIRYDHLGISDGNGRVIHNSKARSRVVEESEKEFSGGLPIRVYHEITSDDKIAAYDRARSRVGQAYDLFSDNCEHFVRWAHGLVKESRQLQKYTCIAAGGLAVTKSKNPLMQAAGAGGLIGAAITPEGEDPTSYAVGGSLLCFAIAALLLR